MIAWRPTSLKAMRLRDCRARRGQRDRHVRRARGARCPTAAPACRPSSRRPRRAAARCRDGRAAALRIDHVGDRDHRETECRRACPWPGRRTTARSCRCSRRGRWSQITKYASVSIALPGPTMHVPPARASVAPVRGSRRRARRRRGRGRRGSALSRSGHELAVGLVRRVIAAEPLAALQPQCVRPGSAERDELRGERRRPSRRRRRSPRRRRRSPSALRSAARSGLVRHGFRPPATRPAPGPGRRGCRRVSRGRPTGA